MKHTIIERCTLHKVKYFSTVGSSSPTQLQGCNVPQALMALTCCCQQDMSYTNDKTRKLCYRKDDRVMLLIYGCPENFRDSLTTPTATFLKILWDFVPIWYSFYRPSIYIIPLSALVCPKFQIAVLGGGFEPPILGKGRPQGVGDGTVRKSVGGFLQAVHSNCTSVFTRFRDIAAFVLQHSTFHYPTPIRAKIQGCSLWSRSVMLVSAESQVPKLISREIIFAEFQRV